MKFPLFEKAAPVLVKNGYLVVPLHAGQKHPVPKDWGNFQYRPKDHQYNGCGTGIITKGVPAVDIDVLREEVAVEIDAMVVEMLGIAPKRIGKAPKCLRLYRYADKSFSKLTTRTYVLEGDDPTVEGYKGHRVEILADGQQFVAFNVHPETGQPYSWSDGDPLTVAASALPSLNYAQAVVMIRRAEEILASHGRPRTQFEIEEDGKPHEANPKQRADDPALLRLALQAIPNADMEWEHWIKIGLAVQGALGDDGEEAFLQWSARSRKDNPQYTKHIWRTLRSRQAGAGTIFHLAKKRGWKPPSEHDESVIFANADTITPEPVRWIWSGYLASGKLHIKAGGPGTGKTTTTLAIMATITSGGKFPDGSQAERGSVAMWSGEDDLGDTLAPRLLAMGANMSLIRFVTGIKGRNGYAPFDPSRDVALLSEAMRGMDDVRLLVVDPLVSAVAGDSHKNAETRRSLQPLVDLAHRHRCALLGITHLSKGTAGRDPLERVSGSLAFGALARVVLVAAKQQDKDGKPLPRMLLRVKSNIGPDGGGFYYDLKQAPVPGHPDLNASTVLWAGVVEGNARDLLAQAEADASPNGKDARFLRDLLLKGPLDSNEVYHQGEAAGFAKNTLKRAKDEAKVDTRKTGMKGGWEWFLWDQQENLEGGL